MKLMMIFSSEIILLMKFGCMSLNGHINLMVFIYAEKESSIHLTIFIHIYDFLWSRLGFSNIRIVFLLLKKTDVRLLI